MSLLGPYYRDRSRAFDEFPSVAAGGTTVATHKWYYNGILQRTTPKILYSGAGVVSNEWCSDEVHKIGRSGHYEDGGPLFLVRTSQSVKPVWDGTLTAPSGLSLFVYEGKLYPRFVAAAPAFTLTKTDTEGDVSSYGPEAWRKFKPGRPKANLATFIGEARDLPRLLQFRARQFKDVGGNYLNVQFGWIPFLSDILEMIKLSKNIERELAKIRASNGKWLLRHGSVAEDRNVSAVWSGSGSSSWYGFTPAIDSSYVRFSSIAASGQASYHRKVWFSGRFRYYIPEKELNSVRWRRDTIRKLYGASITPDVLWELMPWSWLIDYFSNAGDVFANLSQGYVDAVAKYAYVMGTTTYAQEQRSSFTAVDGQQVAGLIRRERIYKHRCTASPFGFGLEESDLSDKQKMILIALGLARS